MRINLTKKDIVNALIYANWVFKKDIRKLTRRYV